MLSSDVVRRVVLVTSDPVVGQSVQSSDDWPQVDVLADPDGGLAAAVQAGWQRAVALQPDAAVAVLLADVPALRGTDLSAALHRRQRTGVRWCRTSTALARCC